MRVRPGYSIYLVLVIGSVFSILFITALLGIHSAQRLALSEERKIQAKLLAQSGIVRAEYFMSGNEGHTIVWETPRFEEPVFNFGAINLTIERFGLFSRVASTGIRRAIACTIIGLFGRTAPQSLTPSLTITGHVGGLVLKNGSLVEGDIVLHHGYVYEKKGGKPLTEYTRRLTLKESPSLPFDTLLLPDLFKGYKERFAAMLMDSVASREMKANANDSLFFRKSIVVKGDYRIGADIIDGKVVVVSGTCCIGSEAKLRNVVCFANKIVVEGGLTKVSLFYSEKMLRIEGGQHNSQFFSRDSIIVKKAASFGPMAIITGFREANAKDSLKRIGGGIFIEDGANLRGTIICAASPGVNYSNMSPSITFGKNVVMNGSIITDGDCFMSECVINGRLWTRSILSRDSEGSYIDYLIKTTIKSENDKTPFPLVGDPPVRLIVSVENMKYGTPARITAR